jgi:hypothetical protein
VAAARGQTKQTGRKKVESVNWPVDEDGQPMAQISITASELIPTGNYANVTVGPVTVTRFVKDTTDEMITPEELEKALKTNDKVSAIAIPLNRLAEIVESDCIAEQRQLVLDSLQADVTKQQK